MDEETRVCTYCMTRQPLSALVPVADSRQCRDFDACTERAAAALLYPVDERALEERSAQPPPIRLPDPARDDMLSRTIEAEARADAGRPIPADVLEIA
jgi:hypothetical protein